MRWPGTIQPSRFLSHTGRVLPGVRRVVQVPNPAAGADWSVTVPAGVQWRVLSGVSTLTTSAIAATRHPTIDVTVDDVLVYIGPFSASIVANAAAQFSIYVDVASPIVASGTSDPFMIMPFDIIPQGGVIASHTNSLEAGDQWSATSLWVEEVYVTDAQLSEDARLHAQLERDIAVYEYEQAQQAGGNA